VGFEGPDVGWINKPKDAVAMTIRARLGFQTGEYSGWYVLAMDAVGEERCRADRQRHREFHPEIAKVEGRHEPNCLS
jgi:hypothetical protein